MKQNDFSICWNLNQKGRSGKTGLQVIGALKKHDNKIFDILLIMNILYE